MWAQEVPLLGSRAPGDSDSKESACNAGGLGSVPGLGGSRGEGNGNPLQHLAWRIPQTEEPGRVQFMGSKSRRQLSDEAHTHYATRKQLRQGSLNKFCGNNLVQDTL